MSEDILYFDEYTGMDEFGFVVHPYLSASGHWCMNGTHYSIEEIGKKCNIPTVDLIMLKLIYGSKKVS